MTDAKIERGEPGPDHPARARVAVDLGQHVAEHVGDREEQHAGAERDRPPPRQVDLRDLGRADQVGAHQHRDERHHHELVVAILPRLRHRVRCLHVASPSLTALTAARPSLPICRMYAVKEIFYTLQGEGANAGRAAVFCRFAGCNLWSGREEDRATAVCRFCDTDFVGTDGDGRRPLRDCGRSGASVLPALPAAPARSALWSCCTGGEPMLQVDAPLIEALHAAASRSPSRPTARLPSAARSTGSASAPRPAPPLVQRTGDELKLVYPQAGLDPEALDGLAFAQPLPAAHGRPRPRRQHRRWPSPTARRNPRWRLSLQTHKLIGIP